jgi:hypothetical protein
VGCEADRRRIVALGEQPITIGERVMVGAPAAVITDDSSTVDSNAARARWALADP